MTELSYAEQMMIIIYRMEQEKVWYVPVMNIMNSIYSTNFNLEKTRDFQILSHVRTHIHAPNELRTQIHVGYIYTNWSNNI